MAKVTLNLKRSVPEILCDIFSFCCVFSGNASNDKRYRTEILVGYVLPLIFSIMTGLVEAFGSRCSSITPKFAEESCFFSCKYQTSIHWSD